MFHNLVVKHIAFSLAFSGESPGLSFLHGETSISSRNSFDNCGRLQTAIHLAILAIKHQINYSLYYIVNPMSTHGTAEPTFFENRASQRLSSLSFFLSACFFFFRFLFLRALFLLLLRSVLLRSISFPTSFILPCVRTKITSWLSSGNVNNMKTTSVSVRRSVDVLMALKGRCSWVCCDTFHTDYEKRLSCYFNTSLF